MARMPICSLNPSLCARAIVLLGLAAFGTECLVFVTGIGVASCGALVCASPSTSNCLILLVTSEPQTLTWTLCVFISNKKKIPTYSFVTVYCMNVTVFFVCHP